MGAIRDELEARYPEVIHQLGNVTVNLYEMSDAVGGKQALVLLESKRRTADGTIEKRTLACDLDRLEVVVEKGMTLKAELERGIGWRPDGMDSKTPLGTLEVGTLTARYFERPGPGEERRLVVRLDQAIEGAKGEKLTQKFACDLERLSKAASYGVSFEDDRGFQKQWNAIVSIVSLAATKERIEVKFMHWEKDDVKAQAFADKNRAIGFGVLEGKSRRPLKGENVTLIVEEERLPSLAAEIRYRYEALKRVGPDHILGIWHQRGEEPKPGHPVEFHGGQDEASREPVPYVVYPRGVNRPQGMNDEPIPVIIRLDKENHPPTHKIEEVPINMEVAERRLAELKAGASPKLEQAIVPEKPPQQQHELHEHILPKGPRRSL